MNIELINDPERFQSMEREWNDLLSRSASDVPFLRHEYLTSWWETRGGGEWSGGELAILTGRGSRGDLQAAAPFFLHHGSLLLLGSVEISDFLDFLAPSDQLEPFLKQAAAFLSDSRAPAWKQAELYNILEDSPSLPLLEKTARDQGWDIQISRMQPAPSLKLPSTWESYLASLENRYRHEIERKIRRAESYFLPVDWYVVERAERLDEEVSSFLELMAYHPDKADFLTDTMASQMRLAVHRAFDQGWVQLSFLTVGDLKAAGYLNFLYDDRIWIYNSGLNPMFENLSPGWVLLGYLIRRAIQQGYSAVDFMRGDEAYKYHFGGVNRYINQAIITRDPS